MKKTVLFFMVFLTGTIFSASLFARGGIELKVTNKTGALVQEIVLTETDTGKIRNYYPQLENKESAVIKVKKNIFYDITLVDSNRHTYGVTRRRWGRDFNEVEISHFDYIYKDFGGLLNRMIGR